MKDKIDELYAANWVDENTAKRIAKCWNILRTMTDEQLVSLEGQVDAIVEDGTMVVGVNIGPELPF